MHWLLESATENKIPPYTNPFRQTQQGEQLRILGLRSRWRRLDRNPGSVVLAQWPSRMAPQVVMALPPHNPSSVRSAGADCRPFECRGFTEDEVAVKETTGPTGGVRTDVTDARFRVRSFSIALIRLCVFKSARILRLLRPHRDSEREKVRRFDQTANFSVAYGQMLVAQT
jgi:hypothetical protein